MTWEVARRSLDWYLGHEIRDTFRIGFYGGEPLMAFPMIERIVGHARKCKGEAVQFSVTTNGTLLTDAIGRFLIAEGFRLLISLDGPASVHDRYRVFRNGRGSHSKVWEGVERLHALDHEYFRHNVTFNMVLARPLELKRIGRFIDENPHVFGDVPIMVSGVNTQPSRVHQQMSPHLPHRRTPDEVRESADMYEELRSGLCAEGKPAGFARFYHERDWITVHQRPMTPMDHVVPSHGQCVPGKRKCMVDGDGRLYMCERVNPAFEIGDVEFGIDGRRVREFLRAYNQFFREQCADCWAVRLCQKCYNDVRAGQEWSRERGRDFCLAERARLGRVLAQYCEIREQRNDAFRWVEDIEVT
jgi:uncharacterized protein